MITTKFKAKTDNGHWVMDANFFDIYDIDKNTICQFTGLTDKNGKEVYIGDKVMYEACTCIVKFGFHKVCYLEQLGIWQRAYGVYLEFENNGAEDPIDENTIAEWEVIGNIYDI